MNITNLLARSLCATLVFVGSAVAQKDYSQKHPDPVTLPSDNVKDILLLMDTDKNGKITKDEWMKFMEKEFDRLDVDKNGALDPKELQQSRVSVKCIRYSDAGK